MEGKLDLLKKKYNNISSDDIEEIYSLDPSKTKKYSNWMVRQFANGYSLKDIHSIIIDFEKKQKLLSKQDIEQYKTLDTLKSALSDVSSKSEEKRKTKKEGSKKIYEDDEVLVIRLDSKEACVIYGKGSKWCIAQKEEEYYERYKSNNVIFYFLLSKIYNDSINSKIAISVERDTENNVVAVNFWDAQDGTIKPEELAGLYKNGEKIISICIDNAKKQESSILSKIINGTYSREELDEYIKFADINSEFFRRKIFPKIREEDDDIIINYLTLDNVTLEVLKSILPGISNVNMIRLLDKGFLSKIIQAYEFLEVYDWGVLPESLLNKIIESRNVKGFFILFYSMAGRKLLYKNYILPIENIHSNVLKELEELMVGLLNIIELSEKDESEEKSKKVTEVMTNILSNYLDSIKRWNLKNILLPQQEYYRIAINIKDFLSKISVLESLTEDRAWENSIIDNKLKNKMKIVNSNLGNLIELINGYLSKNL